MKNRWEETAADHDVREAVGISGAKALTIALPTLLIVGSVGGLIDSCYEEIAGDTGDVCAGFEGEFILHLWGERDGVLLVGDVEVWNDAEDALLLCCLGLFESELLHGDGGYCCFDDCGFELDVSEFELLAGADCDGRRGPIAEPVHLDDNLVRDGWVDVFKDEESCLVRGDGLRVA